eukprot:Tbor_TRINITY_DN5629_c5_g2::TRINITY_DN5629_c5_g2_i1::g.8605::m.8605/K09487/HSP90B, TRA1; heat shock protein 90kDa beta
MKSSYISVATRIFCVTALSLAIILEQENIININPKSGNFIFSVGASASSDTQSTTKGPPVTFGADVSKILSIVISNLYTNRNIFLREIISNGSDALSKVRLLYISNPKDPKNDKGASPTMDIRIRVNKEEKQFIMTDGGCGMTKEELEGHLGSLGSSGTKKFLEERKGDTSNTDADYIGQFGVGFYSVFLVADRISVASKSDNDGKQWVWESTGDGTYYIYEDVRGNTLGRGTELTLHMKKDAEEYLDIEKIKEIIRKYSEFVTYPIYVQTSKTEKVVKEKKEEDDTTIIDDDNNNDNKDLQQPLSHEAETDEEITTTDWELVNENRPIWTRKPSEVTEDEYNKFYKSISKDYDSPLYYHHFSAEGGVDFTSILFIPPKGEGIGDTSRLQNNIRLFVRRIFITDEFKDLMPRYLNFIKGVVDSDDLPLNVSRETLQEHRILKVIKTKLVRKSLQMISEIADHEDKALKEMEEQGIVDKGDEDGYEEEEKTKNIRTTTSPGSKTISGPNVYSKFWEQYGKNIRLGVIEDGSNRVKLTKLLRYKTSKSEKRLIGLQKYVDRMSKGQKYIYYISGDSIDKIKQAPVLEDATRRNIEVIYMLDAIDEYVIGNINDFSGKKLINLAKEGVVFDEETKKDKAILEKRNEKYQPLFKYFRNALGEKVTKVLITKRTTSEPIILSSREHDITARMATILKGQTLGVKADNRHDKAAIETKRVMEINHLHPLIDEIFRRVQVNINDTVAEDITLVLFDVANLQNGFEIEDSLVFSQRIGRLLRASVDIEANAPMISEDLSQYEPEIDNNDDDNNNNDDDDDDEPSTAGAEDDL